MKKLLFIIVAILPLYCVAHGEGWDDANNTGTGDMLSSAFVDSTANNHPIVKADTMEADVFRSKTAHIYDLFKSRQNRYGWKSNS
jgi:hypothetical protein